MKEQVKIKLKTVTKLEKYEDGVTQEEINKGIVKSIETIEQESIIEVTTEQARLMGLEV